MTVRVQTPALILKGQEDKRLRFERFTSRKVGGGGRSYVSEVSGCPYQSVSPYHVVKKEREGRPRYQLVEATLSADCRSSKYRSDVVYNVRHSVPQQLVPGRLTPPNWNLKSSVDFSTVISG